ncbi:MAG: ATP-binding protein [Acidobacteria bacterium]|nr:ATP-binding protein [Acidobacteriota bacterium]
MQKKILIVDDHDDLASLLTRKFTEFGHSVTTVESRDKAVDLIERERFSIVISDLDGVPDTDSADDRSAIKSFKLSVNDFNESGCTEEELKQCIEITLNCKSECVDKLATVQAVHEKIEFEVPSLISLMHDILAYLMRRVEKVGVINPETSNLFIALDEAFVNAVKHGNKFDSAKLVRISADVSPDEARFTIEDEGDGFDVSEIPDPLDPVNLFKTSGRGVLFIYNIMDEVSYNDRGNRLTMVKRPERP